MKEGLRGSGCGSGGVGGDNGRDSSECDSGEDGLLKDDMRMVIMVVVLVGMAMVVAVVVLVMVVVIKWVSYECTGSGGDGCTSGKAISMMVMMVGVMLVPGMMVVVKGAAAVVVVMVEIVLANGVK